MGRHAFSAWPNNNPACVSDEQENNPPPGGLGVVTICMYQYLKLPVQANAVVLESVMRAHGGYEVHICEVHQVRGGVIQSHVTHHVHRVVHLQTEVTRRLK